MSQNHGIRSSLTPGDTGASTTLAPFFVWIFARLRGLWSTVGTSPVRIGPVCPSFGHRFSPWAGAIANIDIEKFKMMNIWTGTRLRLSSLPYLFMWFELSFKSWIQRQRKGWDDVCVAKQMESKIVPNQAHRASTQTTAPSFSSLYTRHQPSIRLFGWTRTEKDIYRVLWTSLCCDIQCRRWRKCTRHRRRERPSCVSWEIQK